MMVVVLVVMVCSLRALYGTDLRHNGLHCSSSCQEAAVTIRFFFNDSQSLSLVASLVFTSLVDIDMFRSFVQS